jgi:CCR4-NOT transcription complex subunit 1
MDVFTKYFRRILQQNAGIVFPSNGKVVEKNTIPTYKLLSEELNKLAGLPDQAEKIAASLDTTEGDLFRDLDLAALTEHFKLESLARLSLALALHDASRADVRSKGQFQRVHTAQPHC